MPTQQWLFLYNTSRKWPERAERALEVLPNWRVMFAFSDSDEDSPSNNLPVSDVIKQLEELEQLHDDLDREREEDSRSSTIQRILQNNVDPMGLKKSLVAARLQSSPENHSPPASLRESTSDLRDTLNNSTGYSPSHESTACGLGEQTVRATPRLGDPTTQLTVVCVFHPGSPRTRRH